MLKSRKSVVIFFCIYFIITNIAYGKIAINNEKWNNFVIEIANKHDTEKATVLPFHSLEYQIILPQDGSFSGDSLKGRVDDKHVNVIVSNYVDNHIIADLTVIDPAIGKRVVWDGQILFEKDANRLKVITRKQHTGYIIDPKLMQPSVESPRFILDIFCL